MWKKWRMSLVRKWLKWQEKFKRVKSTSRWNQTNQPLENQEKQSQALVLEWARDKKVNQIMSSIEKNRKEERCAICYKTFSLRASPPKTSLDMSIESNDEFLFNKTPICYPDCTINEAHDGMEESPNVNPFCQTDVKKLGSLIPFKCAPG